jgi:hypothetical protein
MRADGRDAISGDVVCNVGVGWAWAWEWAWGAEISTRCNGLNQQPNVPNLSSGTLQFRAPEVNIGSSPGSLGGFMVGSDTSISGNEAPIIMPGHSNEPMQRLEIRPEVETQKK